QDPQIVWKNLSSTATLSYTGGPGGLTSTSHGPKVIPPRAIYDTARYGDRPFPVVPVDYSDRQHAASHTGRALETKIDAPSFNGSTFNLYQEMSLGQLYPHGDVPSADLATGDFDVTWKSPRYQNSTWGDQFTAIDPGGTCHGATLAQAAGSPVYSERIHDGWYQLPGTTDYYGDDGDGSAIIGAEAGV